MCQKREQHGSTDSRQLVRNAWWLFSLAYRAWESPITNAGLTSSSFSVLEIKKESRHIRRLFEAENPAEMERSIALLAHLIEQLQKE